MPKANEKLTTFQESLRAAERHLSRRDSVLRPFIKRHGPCKLRPQTRHFETLIEAIISQQLSTKVADTIIARFKSSTPPPHFQNRPRFSSLPTKRCARPGCPARRSCSSKTWRRRRKAARSNSRGCQE